MENIYIYILRKIIYYLLSKLGYMILKTVVAILSYL